MNLFKTFVLIFGFFDYIVSVYFEFEGVTLNP